MKKPINRKELEALVEKAWSKWVVSKNDQRPWAEMVVDAIWGEMVATRRDGSYTDKDEEEGTGRYDPHLTGPDRRILVCTDDPPVAEDRALKLARMVRGVWPKGRSGDGHVARLFAEADRIIEEADDGN